MPGIEAVPVDDRADAEDLVRSGDVEAAIVPSETPPLGLTILGDRDVPSDLISLLSVSPPVELLDANAPNPFLAYLVAIAFGVVFFASAMTFGMTIAQSVVEEKSDPRHRDPARRDPHPGAAHRQDPRHLGARLRSDRAHRAGRRQSGAALSGQLDLLPAIGPAVAWFGLFFIVGFVLLASMFAATGALVSRQEDIGSTTTPVTMLVMIPYFLVIFFNNNPLVVGIMSYVPFSAPIAMPLRIFLGTAQWWEPLVSLAILVLTTVLLIGSGRASTSARC